MTMVTLTALNGAQYFAFYAQVLLSKIFAGSGISVSLLMNLALVSEAAAQFTSMLLVHSLKRRTLFLVYGTSLALLNLALAASDHWDWHYLAAALVLVMIFSSECLGVPVQILYTVEIVNNSSLGLIQLYSNLVFMGVGTFVAQMVHYFSVPVLFLVSAACCTGQALFVGLCVKETSGLTDKEKKSLYAGKSD